MFAPPADIATRVFARLPEELKTGDPTGEFGRGQPAGGPPTSVLEGPSFDRDGNLYVTDIPFGRVFRISPEGEWEQVTEYDGWPNGLKIHQDGRLFITDYKRGLMLLDPGTGAVGLVERKGRFVAKPAG